MFGNNANNDETFIQGKSTSIWDRPDVHIADTLIKGLIKKTICTSTTFIYECEYKASTSVLTTYLYRWLCVYLILKCA